MVATHFGRVTVCHPVRRFELNLTKVKSHVKRIWPGSVGHRAAASIHRRRNQQTPALDAHPDRLLVGVDAGPLGDGAILRGRRGHPLLTGARTPPVLLGRSHDELLTPREAADYRSRIVTLIAPKLNALQARSAGGATGA